MALQAAFMYQYAFWTWAVVADDTGQIILTPTFDVRLSGSLLAASRRHDTTVSTGCEVLKGLAKDEKTPGDILESVSCTGRTGVGRMIAERMCDMASGALRRARCSWSGSQF